MRAPVVIRSEAQRLLFVKIARGEPHPSLTAEEAQTALEAHGDGVLPLRAPKVVQANMDRGATVSRQRIARRERGRG